MTDQTTARGEDAPDNGRRGYARSSLVKRQALADVTSAAGSMVPCST